jgi:hypothetical protein
MQRTRRVKVQDEQGPATGQAKQGTGSVDNAQDRKCQGTGRAGSSHRTEQGTGSADNAQDRSRHRTGGVKVKDRPKRYRTGWTVHEIGRSGYWTESTEHRQKMELDLQSLFGLLVHRCTHWLRPRNPPPPHLGSYTRALLVSRDRRYLFVTPWYRVEDIHGRQAQRDRHHDCRNRAQTGRYTVKVQYTVHVT